jgi:hypothetical protein
MYYVVERIDDNSHYKIVAKSTKVINDLHIQGKSI